MLWMYLTFFTTGLHAEVCRWFKLEAERVDLMAIYGVMDCCLLIILTGKYKGQRLLKKAWISMWVMRKIRKD